MLGDNSHQWRPVGTWSDKHRCGPPRKLPGEQSERLLTLAREAPLTTMALQAKHKAASGAKVSIATPYLTLKTQGFFRTVPAPVSMAWACTRWTFWWTRLAWARLP